MTKVALALTWDGARWPKRSLPAKAKAFLGDKTVPSRSSLTRLFTQDQVKEIRICWVPRLKGGVDTLSEPFPTADGKRLPFTAVKTTPFGDVLGVVYRRN